MSVTEWGQDGNQRRICETQEKTKKTKNTFTLHGLPNACKRNMSAVRLRWRAASSLQQGFFFFLKDTKVNHSIQVIFVCCWHLKPNRNRESAGLTSALPHWGVVNVNLKSCVGENLTYETQCVKMSYYTCWTIHFIIKNKSLNEN